MDTVIAEYLRSSQKFFLYYKTLAERAMSQLEDDQLFVTLSEGGNNIAVIVQHLAGNMQSRWGDFPNSDGESEARNRDTEFELQLNTREELLETWEAGWTVFFAALENIDDLFIPVTIRGEQITALEAVQRQLSHYPHHIGQIVLLAKIMRGQEFMNLSVPRGGSAAFNAAMLEKTKV